MITKQQLELRRTALGGSDAPVIVGAVTWKTPLALWLEKRGVATEQPPPNIAMEVGNALEGYVADRWSRDTGIAVREADTVRDPVNPFLIGHPDRWLVGVDEGLEVKVVGKPNPDWGPPDTDLVPLYVHLQVDHYLMVTGARRWHVAALLGMTELRHYVIERDEALIAKLRKLEVEFWQMVQDGTQPPMIGVGDARLMFPHDVGTSIVARPEIADMVLALRNLRAESAQRLEAEQQMVETIQAYMGPNAVLLDAAGNVLATWKSTTPSSRLDRAALRREHPELAQRFSVATPGVRRFILKSENGDTR